MNDDAITTENLTRRFGSLAAVDGLDLAIPRGSLCALMGPNGAGKTTLILMLLRMLRLSGGDASVLGVPVRALRAEHFRRIGYVAEGQQVPDWMTARDLIHYCGRIYPGWDAAFARERLREFDVPLDRRLGRCSRGQRMKALLVSSIGFHPDLLVMDEPFSGLDPLTRDEFASGLLSVAREGSWTMLISSHDVDDVERLVDRVVVMDRGRLALHEDCDALRRRWRRVEVSLAEAPPEVDGAWAGGCLGLAVSGRRVTFIDRDFDAEACRARLRAAFGEDFDLAESPLSLRDAYVAMARSWKQADIESAALTEGH